MYCTFEDVLDFFVGSSRQGDFGQWNPVTQRSNKSDGDALIHVNLLAGPGFMGKMASMRYRSALYTVFTGQEPIVLRDSERTMTCYVLGCSLELSSTSNLKSRSMHTLREVMR